MFIFIEGSAESCGGRAPGRVYRKLEAGDSYRYEWIRDSMVYTGETFTIVCDDNKAPSDISIPLQEYTCGSNYYSLTCAYTTVPYPKVRHATGLELSSLYGVTGSYNQPMSLRPGTVISYDIIDGSATWYWPRGYWSVHEESFSLFMHIMIDEFGDEETFPLLTWRDSDG